MTLTDAEAMRADLPTLEAEHDELAAPCDGCGRKLPVVAGIILLETPDAEPEDFAFCSIGCMGVFVGSRWPRDDEPRASR